MGEYTPEFLTEGRFAMYIDPTCYTTYSGGYWKIKDMMGTGVIITLGYVVINTVWTALIAVTGILG